MQTRAIEHEELLYPAVIDLINEAEGELLTDSIISMMEVDSSEWSLAELPIEDPVGNLSHEYLRHKLRTYQFCFEVGRFNLRALIGPFEWAF